MEKAYKAEILKKKKLAPICPDAHKQVKKLS